MNKLADVLLPNKIPYFICIGTDLSYIDGIAPRLGTKIMDTFRVMGTVGDNLDNVTLKDRIKDIKAIDSAVYQVIALDCAFHHDYKGTEKLVLYENGLKPASYLGRKNFIIGDVGVGINVSPVADSINDFLTSSKRMDIYHIELEIEIMLLKAFQKYSLPMQCAILNDLGYTKEEIVVRLSITKDEYDKYIEILKDVNSFIYERMDINEKNNVFGD